MDNAKLAALCGPQNRHLALMEKRLDVRIKQRGMRFVISGPVPSAQAALQALEDLYQRADKGLEVEDVHLGLVHAEQLSEKQLDNNPNPGQTEPASPTVAPIRTPKVFVEPRSDGQGDLIRAMRENTLCFALGPAGTGKTWLAAAHGVAMLQAGEVERIVLVRPVIEAGEKLGYLPGNAEEKVEPYQRPLYDALNAFLGPDKVRTMFAQDRLELAPLAYMRGRTLSRSFVIVDEAQNATRLQMEMVLSRLGFGSQMVICGDPSQSDLGDAQGGLSDAVALLGNIKGIGVVELGDDSVVRHPLVRQIIRRYRDRGGVVENRSTSRKGSGKRDINQ